MDRRRFVMAAAAAFSPGCALIFTGAKPKDERDKRHVMWGFVILDLLWVVTVVGLPIFGVFLIVDLATGAIYQRKLPPRTLDPDDWPDEDELPDDLDGWIEVEGPLATCHGARGADGADALVDHLAACATCQRAVARGGEARRVRIAGVARLERRRARIELRAGE